MEHFKIKTLLSDNDTDSLIGTFSDNFTKSSKLLSFLSEIEQLFCKTYSSLPLIKSYQLVSTLVLNLIIYVGVGARGGGANRNIAPTQTGTIK